MVIIIAIFNIIPITLVVFVVTLLHNRIIQLINENKNNIPNKINNE